MAAPDEGERALQRFSRLREVGLEELFAMREVLEVPAHTRGAITFVIDGNAFTGDTLFAMGCGRLFEGDPQMMWTSLSKLMPACKA